MNNGGTGLMIAALAMVALFVGYNSLATRDDSGAITSAGSVDAFEIRVGDCFDDDGVFDSDSEDEVQRMPGVPCGEPHDNEVYAAFDIPGDVWPGQEEVERAALEGCFDRFEQAIGRSYEESVIDFSALWPTEGSWSRVADREVLCIAFHMEYEKLTGTVTGSGM